MSERRAVLLVDFDLGGRSELEVVGAVMEAVGSVLKERGIKTLGYYSVRTGPERVSLLSVDRACSRGQGSRGVSG